MNLKKICRGCFREKPEAGGTCPYCGFDEIKYEQKRDPEVLPLNTVLQGKYVIGRCLGRGGFGITYMGWHANLQTVIAIKEFFPSGIVSRDTGNPDRATRSDVTMVNTGSTKSYRKSLDGFIKEARTLGGLRLPGVVLVHDFFEENRTAYIVMDYVEGENLSLWLKHSEGKLPEMQVLKLVRPLTGSLQKLHEKGIIHRDISPDNLILQPDGNIMLVDFGAARTVVLEQEAESAVQSMTVVLKPGYAPMEQYSSHGYQGPWTDVYAFCATVYRMLTGSAPADPSTRSVRDNDEEMLRAGLESAGVSQGTINALLKGMQLRPQNRYQSMQELGEVLYRETKRENLEGGNRTQKLETGQKIMEREPATADRNISRLKDIDNVRKKDMTNGHRNSETPETSGHSHSSDKKTYRRLITAVLAGVAVLIAVVIGFAIQSRYSKRQETNENVSEAESKQVADKESEVRSQMNSEKALETESQEASERITEALYLLTVENGKVLGTEDSTGSFHEGDQITVEPEKREHYRFTGWTVSDESFIQQTDGKNLIITMPAKDFTVAAKYEEATYTLTVENGTGTGGYHAGDKVSITAEEREGYEFSSWKVERGDISIEDTSLSRATVVMGEEDTTVKAVYTEKAYTVTVNGGSIVGGENGGKYKPGTTITIKADVAEGYTFSTWDVDLGDITLTDQSAEQTTFKMGNKNVEIIAVVEKEAVETEKAINTEFVSCEVGDIITFGTYEQDNDTSNGSEPIEWLILDKEDDKMLVISKYGLDARAYNEDRSAITWENCTLRHWLNGEFYQTAFNDEEQGMIVTSYAKAEDNNKYGISAGNDTEDKVFLLSVSEAERLFENDEARQCYPTEYTINQEGSVDSTGHCWWWMRSPGNLSDMATGVVFSGNVSIYGWEGCYVSYPYHCVRPALWIDLPESKGGNSSDKIDGTEITEETIRKAQAALNAAGYDCGTPDGKAGSKTIAALNAYQADNELDITSVVTQADVDSLGVE